MNAQFSVEPNERPCYTRTSPIVNVHTGSTEENHQYPVYCRKPMHLDAAEEVLLDVKELR